MRRPKHPEIDALGPCSPTCTHAVVAELQQPGETREQWLARLAAIANEPNAGKPIPGRGGTPADAIVGHLSADAWTSTVELAKRLGMHRTAVYVALTKAQRKSGARIERNPSYGWRLAS
jgi:biotin operon repressor